MKIRKTLKFMVHNPTPMFLYFLICWILFSALGTIADDPFIYGTLPDAADEVRDSANGLPWSIWKLCTALSLMIEEIAHDLSYVGFWFVIGPAFLIGYLEAKGSIKGIDGEKREWMDWYGRQHEMKERSGSYERPFSSKNLQVASYPKSIRETAQLMLRFPMQLIVHFVYWITAFAFLTIIFKLNSGIVAAIHHSIGALPGFLIPSAILALISCYGETKGYQKGVVAERNVWMEWYNRQHAAITSGNNFEGPPSSEQVRVESYFKTATETVIFMLRNPKSILIHFISWLLGITMFLIISVGIMAGHWAFPSVQEVVRLLLQFTIPAAIFAVIISYREARGYLKGIASKQQVRDKWYTQQTKQQEGVIEGPPFSENTDFDFYFMIAKKTLLFILQKPYKLLFHLICWLFGFVVVYGATDLITIERLPDFAQILLVVILAVTSCYQETKGYLIGTDISQNPSDFNSYQRYPVSCS